jgi:hypothetical protein
VTQAGPLYDVSTSSRYDELPVQSAELSSPDALCEETCLPSTLSVQATVPPLVPTVAITLYELKSPDPVMVLVHVPVRRVGVVPWNDTMGT